MKAQPLKKPGGEAKPSSRKFYHQLVNVAGPMRTVSRLIERGEDQRAIDLLNECTAMLDKVIDEMAKDREIVA